MGYVKASRRAKAYYRSGRKKATKLKSATFKVKQAITGHAYVLGLPSRGNRGELQRIETRARRFGKILKAKKARGFRISAYK